MGEFTAFRADDFFSILAPDDQTQVCIGLYCTGLYRISLLAFRTESLYTQPSPLVPAFGSFSSRATPMAGGRASSASFRYEKRPQGLHCKRFLRHLAVPPSFLP